MGAVEPSTYALCTDTQILSYSRRKNMFGPRILLLSISRCSARLQKNKGSLLCIATVPLVPNTLLMAQRFHQPCKCRPMHVHACCGTRTCRPKHHIIFQLRMEPPGKRTHRTMPRSKNIFKDESITKKNRPLLKVPVARSEPLHGQNFDAHSMSRAKTILGWKVVWGCELHRQAGGASCTATPYPRNWDSYTDPATHHSLACC